MRFVAALILLGLPGGACATVNESAAHTSPTYAELRPHTPVPRASLFFSAPLVLANGTHAEPHDLLAFVDDTSATATAVRAYDGDRAGFYSLFAAGAVLELASTASTIVTVAQLSGASRASTANATLTFVAGRAVEVAGFGAMFAGWWFFGQPSITARDEAFDHYDADLRAHLAHLAP